MDRQHQLLTFVLLLGLVWRNTEAQDDMKPRIYTLHIKSDIEYRFATTLVTSKVANPATEAREAVFRVTLPNEAFISNFTLEIDEKIYPGIVKGKETAKQEYAAAKAKGQSAGHVSARPRETNRFDVEVNVAALSKVTFNLTYQELLKRDRGVYKHVIYIDPGQTVEDMTVDVAIQESRPITALRVPPLRNDVLTDIDITGSNTLAIVRRPTPTTAYIQYYPTATQQSETSVAGLSGQFVVEYDVERDVDAGDVLVVNGYFVHFFAPLGMDPIPKDVLFILDVSGSMSGTKLKQLKDAMFLILDDLHEGDRFNIMKFSTGMSYWKPLEIATAQQDTVASAKEYVSGLNANGWTNINGALTEGVEFLSNLMEAEGRAQVMVFLTDGEATKGEENTDKIIANVRSRNEGNVPIFSLAFGRSADYDLLKKLATHNHGVARKIYEDSDAALQISGFYDQISTILLRNVTFTYLDETVNETSLTKSTFHSFFKGSEMVVAGRLDDFNVNILSLSVTGNGLNGVVELQLNADTDEFPFSDVTNLTRSSDFQPITEKIWAYLTIKQLLAEAEGDAVKDVELKEKALQLSLKYNFVTPLTSMIVTKPDSEEPSTLISDEALELSRSHSSSAGRSSAGSFFRTGLGSSRRVASIPQLQSSSISRVGVMHSPAGRADPLMDLDIHAVNYDADLYMLPPATHSSPPATDLSPPQLPTHLPKRSRTKGKKGGRGRGRNQKPKPVKVTGKGQSVTSDLKVQLQNGKTLCVRKFKSGIVNGYRLLRHALLGVTINADLINTSPGRNQESHFGRLVIITNLSDNHGNSSRSENYVIDIGPDAINVNGTAISWTTPTPIAFFNHEFEVAGDDRTATMHLSDGSDGSDVIVTREDKVNSGAWFQVTFVDNGGFLTTTATGILPMALDKLKGPVSKHPGKARCVPVRKLTRKRDVSEYTIRDMFEY